MAKLKQPTVLSVRKEAADSYDTYSAQIQKQIAGRAQIPKQLQPVFKGYYNLAYIRGRIDQYDEDVKRLEQ